MAIFATFNAYKHLTILTMIFSGSKKDHLATFYPNRLNNVEDFLYITLSMWRTNCLMLTLNNTTIAFYLSHTCIKY